MAVTDIQTIGAGADKLYHLSGQFTTTIKTSQSISGNDGTPTGITYDKVNTPWVGNTVEKLFLTSGQFTSTIKDSEDVSSVDTNPSGISYDLINTPWSGEAGKKLYLQSGQFTSTLKTSETVSTVDSFPSAISWDGAWDVTADTPWAGRNDNKLYLTSGQFTSTLKDSEDVSAIETTDVYGISFDGTDTPWNGFDSDKFYVQSGQFTSTIKTSLSMNTVDIDPQGLDSHSRLGTKAASFSMPLLTLSAQSGIAEAIFTLPILSLSARSTLGVECVVMNTKNFAVSEYVDYGFNSMTRFNGANLIADQNGIYEQDTTDLDDSAYKIKAHIKTGQIDTYADAIQRLRNGWLSHETDGDIKVVSRADKKATRTYPLTFQVSQSGIRERRVKFERGIRNRVFDFKIQNVDGSQMEVDKLVITLEPIISKRR